MGRPLNCASTGTMPVLARLGVKPSLREVVSDDFRLRFDSLRKLLEEHRSDATVILLTRGPEQ